MTSGSIRVMRATSYADWRRAYHIEVDGERKGTLSAGESVDISVAAGPHTVRAVIDWCGSNTLSVEVAGASTTTIECGNSLRGLRLLFGIVYLTVFRNRYLWIRPAALAA